LIKQGISLAGRLSQVRAIDGYLTLALLNHARGDHQTADNAIQTARQLARQFEMTKVDDYVVEMVDARFQLAREISPQPNAGLGNVAWRLRIYPIHIKMKNISPRACVSTNIPPWRA